MEENILREIGTISRALNSISNIEFKDIQLEKGQFIYLSRISENPGITQNQLSNLICVDKTTTNRVIGRLVDKKLIVKKDDPNNQKNKLLYATSTGLKRYETLKNEEKYSTKVALEGLTAQDITVLNKAISQISQNVVTDWSQVKKGIKRNY